MTVNLTLNDISAKGAGEVLRLIQSIETQLTARAEPAKHEQQKTEAVEDFLPVKRPAADTESIKQPDESKFTIEDVRSAFAKFAKANGKDAAKNTLARFGANKVTELKESDYSAVMKALEEE